MASTESPQKGGDFVLGLSAKEAKLIILGKACTGKEGKMDYEKLSQLGGYTVGSAQVMYRKAMRKLLDANPELPDASGKSGGTTPADGTPAGKKTGAGNKRKSASATTTPVKKKNQDSGAAETSDDDTAAAVAASVADAAATAPEETEASETPSKRARKTPTKKGIAQKVNKKDQAAKNTDENTATTPESKAKGAGKKSPAKSPVKNDESTPADTTLAPAVKHEDPDFNLAGESSVEREIDFMQG